MPCPPSAEPAGTDLCAGARAGAGPTAPAAAGPPDSSRADELVRRMIAGKRRAEASVASSRSKRKPPEKKSQMNFYADSAVREAIRRLAFERRCSMTEILNDAVRMYAPEHVRQAEKDLMSKEEK